MEAIVSSDNDYLIKVKANQPKLYQQIETQSLTQIPVQKYVEHERTRDRDSNRIIEVYEVPENIDPVWIGAGCVIKVERSGTRGSEPYSSISYYLCSLPPLSRRLAALLRGHWLIENRLHWVKDVIMEEDHSPQKAGFAAINLSLLKSWVLTLLRIHGFDSLKEAISLISHNLKYILSFCT